MELRGRGDARAADGPAGPAAQPRPALRRAGRRRPRPRPRRRHRPPRHQALERHGDRGRHGQDPRLRPRQARRDAVPRRRRADGQSRARGAPEPGGRDRRHARLHVARAGGGRPVDARTDVFSFGVAPLRDAHRAPPLPARLAARDALGHPRGRPGAADTVAPGLPPGGRAGHPALPAQGTVAPLAEHVRPLGRPPRPAGGLRVRAGASRGTGRAGPRSRAWLWWSAAACAVAAAAVAGFLLYRRGPAVRRPRSSSRG